MKIASKISSAFLITAVIITGVCAPLFYTIAKKSLEERIYAHLETTAQSRAHHIETYLEEHKIIARILAGNILLKSTLREIVGIGKDSDNHTGFKNIASMEAAIAELNETVESDPHLSEICVISSDGTVVISTEPNNIGLNKSSCECFLSGLKQLNIVDAHLCGSRNREVISISTPLVCDATKTTLGVIIVKVDLRSMYAITTDTTGLGQTGEIFIVNKEGYMITPSRFEKDTFLKQKVDTLNVKHCRIHTDKNHVSRSQALNLFRSYRGTMVLGTHAYIPEMDWFLCSEMSVQEAFAPLAKVKILFVIIMILAPSGAWLIGIFFSGIISKPIRKLQAGAEIIGRGKLDYKVGVNTKDEIGQLSQAFDQMSEDLKESHLRLKESHKELEKKVQERTVELSLTNKQLQDEIEEHSLAREILTERIKELGCLYGLSKVMEKQKVSMEQIFQETVVLVRAAYRFPELTCVRVTFEGIQYKTDNFRKTEISQYAGIYVRGEKAGEIEVYYLGPGAENQQTPFTEEERELLNAVVERLGRTAERKKAAEKLNLLQSLLNRASDSIFIVETEWGRILDVNNRTCESLGYTREELLNLAVKDINETMADNSLWKKYAKQIQNAGNMVLEATHKRKDGTTFPVEVNVKYMEQDGKSYQVAIARDITERKLAEEKISRQSEFLRRTIEALGHPFYVINTSDYTIAMANSAGQKQNVPANAPCYMISHNRNEPCGNTELPCPLEQVKTTGEPVTVEHVHYDKEGNQRNVEVHVYPLFDNEGNVSQIIEYTIDITERKRAEERQAKLLEQVKCANQELKDFAYIVSHDLKAPLRGIKILANWISTDYKDKLDDAGKEQMDLLSRRVERMHNLIDGVLQYSRVGRVKQAKIKINLNELVPEIIDTLAPPENIEITIENELPVIEFERTRIIQVFQNLLSNAVKFMDKPQGRINIGCVEENEFWKFSISDNGPGIEEKHFERIFKIFQTLSSDDEYESTGVGLTVVKKIVELYGGRIYVRSEVGKGSTFFWTLPRQEVKDIYAELETNIVG